MKKILKTILIITTFMAFTVPASAHQVKTEKPNILDPDGIATADLSAFRNCNGDQACLIVRQQIIEILEQLIEELIAEIEKEKERSELDGDLVVIDEDEMSDSEREEYVSRLSEEPLSQARTKSFRVRNGQAEFDRGTHPIYLETWKLVEESFPKEYREKLRYFKFINKSRVENAAYVEVSARSKNGDIDVYFDLVINLDDIKLSSYAQQQRSVEVIIHELGHVIAFAQDQFDYFVDEEDCDYYYTKDLGACADDDSYYTYFYENFWDDDFYNITEEFEDEDDYEIIEDFYAENEDDFVSEYAASSPDEDLAESMLYFFIDSRKSDTRPLMNQKINSFYNFPEMIEIRNYIQRNLFYLL